MPRSKRKALPRKVLDMHNNSLLTEIKECVEDADLVCFDIFDTLITRKVLHPVDVFQLVETMMPARLSLSLDFKKYRISAEQAAYECSANGQAMLKDIYGILEGKLGLTPEKTNSLMDLELEAEKLLAVSRTDVRDLVTELHRSGKKLLLVSDMYLTTEQMRPLLETCGYPNDLPIVVSCEEGKSKGDGSLWKKVVQDHPGARIVHIGDNPRSDYQNAMAAGIKAFLIPNPSERFTHEKLFSCLGVYDNGSFGNSLLLGTVVNEVLYNHAFDAEYDSDRLTQLWLGPVFAKFSRWLAHNEDDCLLLFVTRENYLLRPMYLAYCENAGITPRPNCDFYASRQATAIAAFTNEDNYSRLFQEVYEGSLDNFVRTHCNFAMPGDDPNREKKITLPAMGRDVRGYLEPYRQQIIASCAAEAEVYRTYTAQVRGNHSEKPLTIVDVGYRGTAQYYLSLALEEKVGGEYLFLNNRTMPQRLSCPEKSVGKVTDGRHPLYDNLLFLEGAMQVPCGQLRYLEMDERGTVTPVCGDPAEILPELRDIQKSFLDYVREEALWDRRLNGCFDYSLVFAEDIFAAMIVCDLLPEDMLSALQIDDAFSGHISWRYHRDTQQWESALTSVPFAYTTPQYRPSLKIRVKNYVKEHVPVSLYEIFRLIWVKYIK